MTSTWAVLLVVLLVPATVSAAPAWQPPQLVSPSTAVSHEVALSPTGHALAIWSDDNYDNPTYRYAWRTPHGGWGPSALVPGGATSQPAIGISSFGDATVAYKLPGRGVGIATAHAGEPLKQIETIDGPAPVLPHDRTPVALAVDDEGGATVTWVTVPKALAATRLPGGQFGKAQELGDVAAWSIGLAVNPAGAAIVAWGIGSQAVRARYRLPGETRFGPAEDIPRDSYLGGPPLTRIKDDGTAIVASDMSGQFNQFTGISYSERPPVGRFGPEARLEGKAALVTLLAEPQSASSFISISPSSDYGAVSLTMRSSSGTFAAPIRLSESDTCDAEAGSNPLGQLIAAWARPCNVNSPTTHGIEVRQRPVSGAPFDPPVRLSGVGRYPKVAVSQTGDGIVVWRHGEYAAPLASSAFEDPTADITQLLKPRISGGRRPFATISADSTSVGLPITCPRACTVLPTGIITTRGKARAKAIKAGKRRLGKRHRTWVRVRFSKTRLGQARRALRHGDRATVSYTVTVRKRGSLRGRSFSRRVRLKLPR